METLLQELRKSWLSPAGQQAAAGGDVCADRVSAVGGASKAAAAAAAAAVYCASLDSLSLTGSV